MPNKKIKSNSKSLYIVIEGIAGSGKSTQAKLLHEYLKKRYPKMETVYTREPGGTEIAEKIRKLVQGTNFDEEIDPVCETYLYAASRAQSLRKVVGPVLESGGVVISDRSFLSSMSIQGNFRGLKFGDVYKINEPAIKNYLPDIVFILNINIKTAVSRFLDKEGDKFENEGEDTYKKFWIGLKKATNYPKLKNVKFYDIDANRTPEIIFGDIVKITEKHIKSRKNLLK